MTPSQKAVALISQYGDVAFFVAETEFNKYYDEGRTLVYSKDSHNRIMLVMENSNYWFSVIMNISKLQNA